MQRWNGTNNCDGLQCHDIGLQIVELKCCFAAMNGRYAIRKAVITDIDALARLFDAYRVFYHKASDVAGACRFLTERMTDGSSEIYVAEDEAQRLVGFVQLYPLFSSTRMKKLWLLNDLFVDEHCRGQGISVALIDAAKELCITSGSCGMMLETAKNNIIGNSLYPATGFTLDAEHNFYSWDR